MRLLILLLLSYPPIDTMGAYIKGTVKNSSGEPLALVSVYVKNSTFGVATNTKGEYSLELNAGTYTIVFTSIGYQSEERLVTLTDESTSFVHVTLLDSHHNIDVNVWGEKQDIAKQIMAKVRANRKRHLDGLKSYSCTSYTKIVLEKELARPRKSDTLRVDTAGVVYDPFEKEKLDMIETVSQTHFKRPNKLREDVIAHRDYVHHWYQIGSGETMGFRNGSDDIVPRQEYQTNPYLIYNDAFSGTFNFYENNIDFPAICENPLRSPIASGSGIHYKYNFIRSYYQDKKKIYEIEVIPRNKTDALFSGTIYIEDSTWALDAIDFSINKAAMYFCKDFRIIQKYAQVDSVYVPIRLEIIYTISDGRSDMLGHTKVDYSDYRINRTFPAGFFSNKIKVVAPDASEKDSTFWQSNRPTALSKNERAFIIESDSIAAYYTSDEYYAKEDSMYRFHPIWSTLYWFRLYYRKRGLLIGWGGLLNQINPFGVGGYRHQLPGFIQKEFKNSMLIEVEPFIDYGFNNNDLKGEIGIGWTYFPKKFVRTFVTVGSNYTLINDYASLEETFRRSNYVLTNKFSVAQRVEIINGLFGELTLIYSDQKAIDNLRLSEWSELVFGELNDPISFNRYIKSELKLEMKYRFKQRYVIVKNKKIILDTDYPELHLVYRKGMPGVFNSEVNFDFIEIGVSDRLKLARWGSSGWEAYMGTFLNRSDLRLLEHKYFRGSDRYVFSDPLRSFQLLGPTLQTSSEYLRGNYVHHFDGMLLNKVPILNKLKITAAAGGGAMILNKTSFVHFEMFGGLERIIRIKDQLFRAGVYAVTANNSLSEAAFRAKVGVDLFDRYTKKWTY